MTPAITLAQHKGATFEPIPRDEHGNEWQAVLRKRGRAVPLAVFLGRTQEEAAELFLDYIARAKRS